MSRFAGSLKAEESFRQWSNEDRARRNQYWQAIFHMRSEHTDTFKDSTDLTAVPTLHYWAEQQYGFTMGLDGQGHYTQDYTVVNPKKFMLFQLKFMR